MQNLYCPKCGQNLNGNTNLKFCPKCGAKIQTNISGNLSLIPAITPFLYLYLFLMPGTKGANQYGNDPLENTY